jgi:hypothetical protein
MSTVENGQGEIGAAVLLAPSREFDKSLEWRLTGEAQSILIVPGRRKVGPVRTVLLHPNERSSGVGRSSWAVSCSSGTTKFR